MKLYYAFSGEITQDVGACLASFEHHAISIGRVTKNENFPLLVATFYGQMEIIQSVLLNTCILLTFKRMQVVTSIVIHHC